MILSQEILKPNPENAAPAKLNLFPSSMFPDDLSYFANFPQDKADLQEIICQKQEEETEINKSFQKKGEKTPNQQLAFIRYEALFKCNYLPQKTV